MTPNAERSKLIVTVLSDTEVRLTRAFDYPVRLIWEAYTRPEHLARWWGPRKYETVVDTWDFRAGGAWRMLNRDAEHTHGFRGEFREIVPLRSLTWTFEYEGYPGHVSVETAAFEERDGRTYLTATAKFASIEDRDGMLNSGMESGAAESYDRLEELLAGLR